ncbi:MAG TPA: BREX system P-loop protein BrxC [Candidatus Acetothermia bacterium]|nr:BREX system P-loop protein BrxC [Candidatus Acetothermia bacterium]
MRTIGELLKRDLNQRIEEVVKVNQTDEETVYRELTEYVATESIREHYRTLFQAIAEMPAQPHDGVGVWVSGFFGSGKSSFVKNLGYVLANRKVLGYAASELFKQVIGDPRISEYIDYINSRIPIEVLMFDVSVERAVKTGQQKLAEVMYTVLLRELDYAEDHDIAELEIELEAEGRLAEFIEICGQLYRDQVRSTLDLTQPLPPGIPEELREAYAVWRIIRKGAQKIARSSAILHTMAPETYPSADTWAKALKPTPLTVNKFVERAYELMARRRPGKALVYIIDEVGQYVARSADKIDDLRAVIEQLGKEGVNRTKKRQAVMPIWVIVTSQEKLEEVVAAIDSKRIELARLKDRFRYRVDLAPSDIREVTTKRVLAKKEEAVPLLRDLYRQHQGKLNAACRLERTTRKSDVSETEFIQFYPYLPHYMELSIDIVSGMRLQPGAPQHLGGSNRTLIKQAYEILVSPRTALAEKPIGALVTLDKVYELVEGNLSSERRKDIDDIVRRFGADSMELRVAKVLTLLEFVRDLPRTERNIAACLVEQVGDPAPIEKVKAALERLREGQFVRHTEEGWKLQTAQEKSWATERRSYLQPKPRDRQEVLKEVLSEIFSESRRKTLRYRNLRSFKFGISFGTERLGEEGQIPLVLRAADDEESFGGLVEEIRNESRLAENQNRLYWIFALNPELDNLVAEVHASNEMIRKYDRLRAQGRITPHDATFLDGEKHELDRLRSRLREKLTVALEQGIGVFRGTARDASALGRSLDEILKGLLEWAVPELYPKLELGARPLKGDEARQVLTAANLSALPPVLYDGPQGLGLVVKQGEKFVPNPSAEISREILGYLQREHRYGNRETRIGKALESHFGGLGYGWEPDIIRLALAVLFRAGSIEVSYQGQRYDNYQDPRSHEVFVKISAFRRALFTPTAPLDLKTLTAAVENYEKLTGGTVDVDKTKIGQAIKKWAEEESNRLEAVRGENLPVSEWAEDYHTQLQTIIQGTDEDRVRALAGEGRTFLNNHEKLQRIAAALAGDGRSILDRARLAVERMWPELEQRGIDDELADVAKRLAALLHSETFFEQMAEIRHLAEQLSEKYREFYASQHDERRRMYQEAIEKVKGRAEWINLPPEMQSIVLRPLSERLCSTLELRDDALVCVNCRASLREIEGDIAALQNRLSESLAKLEQALRPEERVERVRVADLVNSAVSTREEVEELIERLRSHLLKLIEEGVRVILE